MRLLISSSAADNSADFIGSDELGAANIPLLVRFRSQPVQAAAVVGGVSRCVVRSFGVTAKHKFRMQLVVVLLATAALCWAQTTTPATVTSSTGEIWVSAP